MVDGVTVNMLSILPLITLPIYLIVENLHPPFDHQNLFQQIDNRHVGKINKIQSSEHKS